MTSIEFLGHAGLAVEHGGRLLLCDPWLSPRGAYNASWFQYPEYPARGLGELLRPDAVYVSHEHPDHYDPWFLRKLPKDTLVLTGRFHKKRCVRKLRQLGFERVVELDDFEPHEIAPGFTVRIAVPAHNCAPHWFDSCALIEAGRRKIFNLNDANFAIPAERLRDERIDVFFGQASPAIWYPLTYDCYAPEERKRLMAQRRESAIESFVAAAKAVRPALAIPFAGPPCFFDPELADFFLEPGSMFPTAPVSAERLRAASDIAAEVLKPGDRLVLDDEGVLDRRAEPSGAGFKVIREPLYAQFDYERDRRAYYESHRAEKEPIVAEELAALPTAPEDLYSKFERHFAPLIRNNPFFRSRIDIRVLFDVTGTNGGRWVVDFRDEARDAPVYAWNGEKCQYEFRLDARNVAQVLRGDMSWEDVLLSFRFRARRDPDRYNQHLFTFFKMGDHAALQEIAKAEIALSGVPDDVFELRVGGCRYSVQRFCPHAGSDLRDAEVVDGMLVCPGHRWHFDLANGQCREADYRIRCERLPDDAESPDEPLAATAGVRGS
jgi:UDP-MurNAc hydroxylase